MLTARHYSNFIFDLYGTLIDIRTDEELPSLWRSISAFFAEKGACCTPDEVKFSYLKQCRLLQKKKDQELLSRNISGPAEIDILDVWDGIGEELDISLKPSEKYMCSRLFRARSTLRLKLYPGVADLLQTLRDSGKTICLLTNAQESFTRPELDTLELTSFFDHLFFSSQSGVKKPSPAFFSELRKAGLDPQDSLMIGNDDICDCHGAAVVGIDSLYIHTEQSPVRTVPLPDNSKEIRSIKETAYFI